MSSLVRTCFGGINDKQAVVICALYGSTFYTLNYYQSTTVNPVYFLDSAFFTQETLPTGPIFTNSISSAGIYYIVDLANNNFITDQTDSSGNIYVGFEQPSSTLPSISISESSYAVWNPPTSLLCDIQYALGSGNFQYSNSYNSDGSPMLQPGYINTTVFFLPGTLYYDCTLSQSSFLSGTQVSLNSWCNNTDSEGPNCATPFPITTGGWTLDINCVNDIEFSYCPTGSNCGANNCNGPCPSTEDICSYNTGNNQFSCMYNIDNLFKQTWFIILMIAIVIVLILLIIFIIF
jgi:hypothetical protein